MVAQADVVRRVLERSSLSPEETEDIVRLRFSSMATTLEVPLKRLRLDLKRTLDVGCGFGQCLIHFGPGSVGLELVNEKVAFARSLGLEVLRCDLDGSLEELGSRRFQAIWCSDVLEHLHAPFQLLVRLADFLEDDGVLVTYVTVRPQNPLVRFAWKRFLGAEPYRATTHHYQFTLPTIRYLLSRAGFRVTDRIVPGIRGERANRAASAVLSSLFPSIVLVARRDADLLRSRDHGIQKNRLGTGADS
jgi:SAM-dependent methyltransferase